ncbi:12257_t:CDS:2, partial [Dentiscutata heterogama]
NPMYESGVIFTDSDPAIAAAISKIFLSVHHHLCVIHISNNVKKKVRSKLGAQEYHQFMNDFYTAHNALQTFFFETRFNQLIKAYPKIESYLNTQRVESYNNLIKASINQSSSLITLYKMIQECLDKESMYSHSQEFINLTIIQE